MVSGGVLGFVAALLFGFFVLPPTSSDALYQVIGGSFTLVGLTIGGCLAIWLQLREYSREDLTD
jgi:hypothetical protein